MRAVKRELEDTTVFPPAASIFPPRGVWICSLRKGVFGAGWGLHREDVFSIGFLGIDIA